MKTTPLWRAQVGPGIHIEIKSPGPVDDDYVGPCSVCYFATEAEAVSYVLDHAVSWEGSWARIADQMRRRLHALSHTGVS
jgi:hypothetical protein